MKKSFILALKLFVICAISTFVLAFTNDKTVPVIEKAAKEEEIKAFAAVYPGLEKVEAVEDASLINENIKGINKVIVAGQDDGYVYTVDSPNGYDGPITFVLGVKNDGTVTGIQILAHTETSGYGSRVADPEYAQGMQGVVLAGALKAEGAGGGPDIIPAIAGATRTSKAMEKAMNMIVETHAALTGASVDTKAPVSDLADKDILEAFPGADKCQLKESTDDACIRKIYEVKKDDQLLDHVFQATPATAFAGPIEFLIGLDKDNVVKGFVIVKHEESPEYGAKIASPEYSKSIMDKKLEEADFAVAGATITSDALIKAIEPVAQAQKKINE